MKRHSNDENMSTFVIYFCDSTRLSFLACSKSFSRSIQKCKSNFLIHEIDELYSIRPLDISVSASFFNLVAMGSSIRRSSWAGGTPNGRLVKRLRRSKSIDSLHQQRWKCSYDTNRSSCSMLKGNSKGK